MLIPLVAALVAETQVVHAYDWTFVPSQLTVQVGDTVEWVYVSGMPDTATAWSP